MVVIACKNAGIAFTREALMIYNVDKQHNLMGQMSCVQVKRKHRRVAMRGFVGDLADGNSIVCGDVENISKTGFKFSNAPATFTAEKFTYTIVLSRHGEHFRVLAKPCWKRRGEKNHTEVGFKILDAPWEWVELTTREIPEFDYNDLSGFTNNS